MAFYMKGCEANKCFRIFQAENVIFWGLVVEWVVKMQKPIGNFITHAEHLVWNFFQPI